MRKRYLKPVSLLELAKALKLSDIPVISNKDKGKQLFLRLTSGGSVYKQGGRNYISEDDVLPSDILILGKKYFKLIQ